MRRWSGFPGDNSDPSIRQWLAGVLMEAGGSMLADPRECAAVADRIMAGVDDRSRTVLDVLDRRYDEAELNRIGNWLDQVLLGVPVQHAVGWTDFRGLRIACGPEALIPRPETEEVVQWFLEGMEAVVQAQDSSTVRVLDVGTGTGCMALAIKAARPRWEVWGMDISEAALELARKNAQALNLDVHWVLADVLDTKASDWPDRVDGIVSNPPYIPCSEAVSMASHVRNMEPELALFVPDSDPLIFHRALAQRALHHLRPGGGMVAECHAEFTREVANCWQLEVGDSEVLCDLQGAERAVRLIRP